MNISYMKYYYLAISYFLSADMPQAPGYFTKKGKFIFVKEMVPEFVVPDLKGFKVK